MANKKIKGIPDVAVPRDCKRLFTGDEASKREFLLRIINGEIKDTYGADINAATKLKAFQMWNEMDMADAERERNKGSTFNIVVGKQGTTFNESMLSDKKESERIEV